MPILHRTSVITICFLSVYFVLAYSCGAVERENGIKEKRSLSGHLFGSKGKEIVLVLNGSEKLKVLKDGPFYFKTSLDPGSSYDVQIAQPPVNHLCEVTNGKGVFDPNLAETLEIKCRETGRWQHPATLSDSLSLTGFDVMTNSVAMDDKGNGIIVWSQFDGSNWRVYRAEYYENKWRKPAGLTEAMSPPGGDARNLRVAMASNGDVVVVWEQVANKDSFIFMAEKRAGKWRLPSSMEDHISPGKIFAWEPELSMDPQGNTIIVWDQEKVDSIHVLLKSEYRNGEWLHPKSVNEHINVFGGDALRPRVVMNKQGEALIVWEQDPGNRSQIYKSEYRNGKWSHPVNIDDHINSKSERGGAHNAIPFMNDNGRAMIVWQQAHANSSKVYMSEYRKGNWFHPKSLMDSISPKATSNAKLNSVGMDNKGNAVIVWSMQERVNQALYKSEFRDGSWKHPGQKEHFVSSPREFEFRAFGRVALSDSGKSVIVWQQRGDDGVSPAFIIEYDNGTWHLPWTRLNLHDQIAKNFRISSSENGNFIICWLQKDNSGNVQVYKSVFRRLDK